MWKRGITAILLTFATTASYAAGTYVPKKAALVAAAPKNDNMLSGNALLSTAIALGVNAMAISDQFKALDATCVPSSSDINFVQKMVLEVAKTGVPLTEFTNDAIGNTCSAGTSFKDNEEARVQTGSGKNFPRCFEKIDNTSSTETQVNGITIRNNSESTLDGAVLNSWPRVSSAKVTNSKNKEINVSNIYEIWAAVSSKLSQEDWLEGEITQGQRMNEQIQRCDPQALKNTKGAAWIGFAQEAIMGMGSGDYGKTADLNVAMQAAQGMTSSGGVANTLIPMLPMLLGAGGMQ
ncbi:MAG: hypothetical protein LBB23_01490 [Rickettsiales bacterium]|jgi:hypothetical protein|nr:hypothetical protein [Rickettsiales bacterium]